MVETKSSSKPTIALVYRESELADGFLHTLSCEKPSTFVKKTGVWDIQTKYYSAKVQFKKVPFESFSEFK